MRRTANPLRTLSHLRPAVNTEALRPGDDTHADASLQGVLDVAGGETRLGRRTCMDAALPDDDQVGTMWGHAPTP